MTGSHHTLNADTDSACGPSPPHRGGLRALFLRGGSIEQMIHHVLTIGGSLNLSEFVVGLTW